MLLSEINQKKDAVEEIKKAMGATKKFNAGYQRRMNNIILAICKEKDLFPSEVKNLPQETELTSKGVVKNYEEFSRWLCECTDQLMN